MNLSKLSQEKKQLYEKIKYDFRAMANHQLLPLEKRLPQNRQQDQQRLHA